MAKDKDRALNPAAAQRKLDKQKALKKGKATVAAQRTERLSRRNPDRLQRQIDDLRALETSGGTLGARDKKLLADLERDVSRVRKARETVGVSEREPGGLGRRRGDGRGRPGGDGMSSKRKRDQSHEPSHENSNDSSSGGTSDTDASVRQIPMPRDTPPPLPSVPPPRQRQGPAHQLGWGVVGNANLEPLGSPRVRTADRAPNALPHALPVKPTTPRAQTVYEAQPAVRDLQKEAVRRFVPGVVARKLDAKRGVGGGRLLEEEEVQRLEAEGYGVWSGGKEAKGGGEGGKVVVVAVPRVGGGGSGGGGGGGGGGGLEEEEDRFEREMRELGGLTEGRGVEMEEVEDEDL